MFGINTQKEYTLLQAFAAEMRARIAEPADGLHTAVPHVSGWTVAQQIHHAAMVNSQVLGRVLAMCEGTAQTSDGKLNMPGRIVLALGRIPRGRGRSPKTFVPAEQPSREQLEAVVEQMEIHARALEQYLDRLPAGKDGFKHPVFGYLDAPQWLKFARIHAFHHLAIIQDIEAEQAKTLAAIAH